MELKLIWQCGGACLLYTSSKAFNSPDEYSRAIQEIKNKDDMEYELICDSAKKAAMQYDYKNSSKLLESLLMETIGISRGKS